MSVAASRGRVEFLRRSAMNELYKIGEAKFFLEKMEGAVGDRQHFRYYLSAFLSAARSVLHFADTEAKKKDKREWYVDNVTQTNIARNNILKDFREKRDANQHRGEPVDPARDVTVAISKGVVAFSAVGEVFFNDQPVEMTQPEQERRPPSPREAGPHTTVRYRFVDWPGPEDLIARSHRYVEELEEFVRKGMEAGILSG